MTQEMNRGRDERREVEVYDDLYGIDKKWVGIKEIVKITRTTYLKNTEKPSIETSYYISSTSQSASVYNKGIRSHWAIENSLHYVKDVVFGEDASLIRTGNAPTNFSIIRNFAINLLRRTQYSSLRQAIRLIGGDIATLSLLIA